MTLRQHETYTGHLQKKKPLVPLLFVLKFVFLETPSIYISIIFSLDRMRTKMLPSEYTSTNV